MSTVFVTLCDAGYFDKAAQTIKDLRTRGNWAGKIVLICIDFLPSLTWGDSNIERLQFPKNLDLTEYVEKIRASPFTVPTNDGRELKKLTQWEKLRAFDEYFDSWERVIWVDAGLRVLDDVKYILEVDWRGKFVCPDDTYGKTHRFNAALEMVKQPAAISELQTKYNVDLDGRFFLNCFWIYDTSLRLRPEDFLPLLKYPVWRHNEMGVMNALIHFKLGLWSELPSHASNSKYLFAWSDYDYRKNWDNFVLIKYPVSIKFGQ
jgi:hypothetical protein